MSDSKHVLFCDLGNVILPFDFNPAMRKLADLAGVSLEEVKDFLFQPGFQEKYETGKLSSKEFLDLIRGKLRLSTPKDQLAWVWNDVFSENRAMIEWLESMIGRFPIWGISNTNALHFDFVRQRYPIVRKFTGWILSYEAGYRKPQPEIFQMALKRSGVSADRAFFVDDLLIHVQAAESVGISSHLFKGVPSLVSALKEKGFDI